MLNKLFGTGLFGMGGRSSGEGRGLEPLEARALLAGDLSVSVGALGSGADRSGNQLIKLPVMITNVGDRQVRTDGSIEYYLSLDRVLDANDYKFTTTAIPSAGRAGGTGRVNLSVVKPALLAPAVGRAIPVGDYFVIAKLVLRDPSQDAFAADDVAVTTGKVSINYQFGTIDGKGGVPLTIALPRGGTATFSMVGGPGVGQLISVDNQVVLVVNGTDAHTTLFIKPSKGAAPTVDGITINGSLKDFFASGVNVHGNITIQGTTGTLRLGDIHNSVIRVNGFSQQMDVDLGRVFDSSFVTSVPVRSFSLVSWADDDAVVDRISTPFITDLTVERNFGASITTASAGRKGFSITNAKIGGNITGGTWDIRGNLFNLRASSIQHAWAGNILGELTNLTTGGNFSGTLGVGNLSRMTIGGNVRDAQVLVGANLGSDARLGGFGSNADHFNVGHIGLVDIRGAMSNAIIAAGLSTTDTILLNGDDRVISNGSIGTIQVRRGMSTSFFAAASLPKTAQLQFRGVTTAGDSRFVTGTSG